MKKYKYPSDRLINPKYWIDKKTGQKYRYFSRAGKGYTDVMDWARDFEPLKNKKGRNPWKNKIVKQDYFFNKRVFISTVWLGLDHSYAENEPPLIFESMVFSTFLGRNRGNEVAQDRYTTESEARAGHAALVNEWSHAGAWIGYFLAEWWYDLKWKFLKFFRKLKVKIRAVAE